MGLVLSGAQGIFHSYYTTEMAPAVAAVSAGGMAGMWRYYRRPGGYRWLLFPAAVAVTVSWSWVLVSRDISWNGWLRDAVGCAGAAAVALLLAGRLSVRGTRSGMSRVGAVLGVIALLLAPGVWSAATAFASSGGAMAQAGPPNFGFGRGRPDQPRIELPAQFRGFVRGDLTTEQRGILTYAQANSGGARIALAVEGGAMAAEAYLIHSHAMIIGMGGFSGQDPAPTVATLAQWVRQGQLRFVLAGGGHGGSGHGLPSEVSRGGVSAQRIHWVAQHCAVVSPTSYGGPVPAPTSTVVPLDRSEVLYGCQPH